MDENTNRKSRAGEHGDSQTPTSGGTLASRGAIVAVGIGWVVLAALLIYLIAKLWPRDNTLISLFGGYLQGNLLPEVRLILLVAAAGALGSYIHSATSFADYVGNRRLYTSWLWWYILRPFIGAALALIFYFAFRGGFLSASNVGAEQINPYGIAALGALSGMFSKQASDKLNEVFSTLFKTEHGSGRKDTLESPKLKELQPPTVKAATNVTVKLIGSGFVKDSVVHLEGKATGTTAFVSASELSLTLAGTDVPAAGPLAVTVLNPPPGGASNSVPLTVVP